MSLLVLFRLPISILLLLGFTLSYVWQEPGGGFFGLLEYGFLALLVGLIIWRVLKAREYRRAEEIEKHVIVTRQIQEMLRRDTTRRRRTRQSRQSRRK